MVGCVRGWVAVGARVGGVVGVVRAVWSGVRCGGGCGHLRLVLWPDDGISNGDPIFINNLSTWNAPCQEDYRGCYATSCASSYDKGAPGSVIDNIKGRIGTMGVA